MRKSLPVALLAFASMGLLFGQSGNPASLQTDTQQTSPTWTQLSIPPAMSSGLYQTMTASSDGYVYVSTRNGIFRAPVANPNVWTAVNNGLPMVSGAYLRVTTLGVTKNGTLLAGVGVSPEYGVARLNPKTLVWQMAKGPGKWGNVAFTSFTSDSAGNAYFTDNWNGNMYKSTDDGLTFSLLVANAYSYMGQPGGAVWALSAVKDMNGIERMYWGGEGILNMSSLDFSQNQTALTKPQGYLGNLTAVAFSASEVLVAKGYAYGLSTLQRFDFATRQWTAIESPQGIPAYWRATMITYSKSTNEYFLTAYSSLNAGVFRSGDGGKTWSMDTAGLPLAVTSGIRTVAVSPVNHAKFAMNHTQIWYRP